MLLEVYSWEENIISSMRALPRSGFLYDFMSLLSDFSKTIWIILFLLIFISIWKGWKSFSHVFYLSVGSAILGDLVSRRIFKAIFMRPRPEYVNAICDKSGCWGFISSHATNVFAVLAVLYFYDKRTLWWALPLAIGVSFSRVFLVDHYPLDVLGGALIGILIGSLVCKIYQKAIKKMITHNLKFNTYSGGTDIVKHSIFVSILGGIITISSIFYSDQAIAKALSDPALQKFRQICTELTDLGLGGIYFGMAAISYALARWVFPKWKSLVTHAELISKVRNGAAFSFLALSVAGLIILSLKIGFGRQRPHVSETFDSFHFEPINFHWYWQSFPSGHSQVIFVVATLMSIAWPKFKIWFLLGAFGIAFTRVATHQHFLSDIVLGGVIGYLTTIWLYNFRSKKLIVAISQINNLQ